MTETIKKPENPAKAFLRRYRACKIRAESLSREIDKSLENATNTAVKLKPVMVQSSGGAYDRMAEDVCRAADMRAELYKALADTNRALAEIMAAIDAVPDEMQKTVLVLRYVEGLDWLAIQEKIGYEDRNTFIIHGRALWAVNQYLKRLQENAVVKGL